MLPKKYRLPAKNFQNTYKFGKKFRGKYGVLIVAENRNSTPLFGFVVSKKIGNAVIRHRFTRILRNISQEAIKDFNIENKGLSFQYIAFEFCNDYNEVKKEFYIQMENAIKHTF